MAMATIPTQTHALLSIPFDSTTDFTVLASHCENLADASLHSDDPAQRQALCKRLTDCLAQLRPTLDDAIPPHLIDSLTVDDRPVLSPRFEPGSASTVRRWLSCWRNGRYRQRGNQRLPGCCSIWWCISLTNCGRRAG
jgi:hypothetical protein